MAMNSRERVLRAIRHEQPDRIPYHIEFTTESRLRMIRYFGREDFESRLGNHMAVTKVLPAGVPREVRPGHFMDEFGVVWDRTRDQSLGIPAPVLPEPTLDGYGFPDPDDPSRYAPLAGWAAENEVRFRVLKMSHVLFERAWSMRGFERFLMDMMVEPRFAEALLARITEFNMAVLENMKGRPIDAVWYGDDWAQQTGLLMSRELWRAMLKPHLARMFDFTRRQGWTVMIHCCGAIEDLLPELIDMGVEVFNPFQPEVMDVMAIKKEFGKVLTFFGGLSIQQLLPFGTPEEVRRETRRMIDEVGEGGGYILSPAHALPGDVPPENLLAMIEEAQK